MKERKKTTHILEVPRGTGRQGFLFALEEILKLDPYDVRIDMRGKVTYTILVPEGGESEPLRLDFEKLSPHSVVRNGEVVELFPPAGVSAAVAITMMFREVTADQLFPVAFVGGAGSWVWRWLQATTSVSPPSTRDEFFGLPLYKDRMFEDDVLILCAGFERHGALIDTQKSYKILMPPVR